MLLSNGVVYIGFGSHGDNQPYHGWILGYNAATLQQVLAFCTTPNGEGGGFWQANGGPAVDSAGPALIIAPAGQGKGFFFVLRGARADSTGNVLLVIPVLMPSDTPMRPGNETGSIAA